MRKVQLILWAVLCSCNPSFEEEIGTTIFNTISQKWLEQAWEDYGQLEKIYEYFRPIGVVDLVINESVCVGSELSSTEVMVYNCSFTLIIQDKDKCMGFYPSTAVVVKKRDAPLFVVKHKINGYEFDL